MIFPIITLNFIFLKKSFITTKINQTVYFEGCPIGYFEDYLKH